MSQTPRLAPKTAKHEGLPELIQAQRRHCRLARRHGGQTAADAFAEAAHITARQDQDTTR